VADAMRSHGTVADDPVWPYHWAYDAAARKHTYNPSAARLRLDAAGLPVMPASGGRMDSRFRINCVFWSGDSQFERIALLLQRQLSSVGIDLQLEPATHTELTRRSRGGDFDSYLYVITSGRSFDTTYRFWHSPSGSTVYQNTGYTGADAVLDALRQARSDAEIKAAVGDLRQRFYEDVPAAFLAWPLAMRAVDARFEVFGRTDPDLFANLWRWRAAIPQRTAQ
jgi:ABC-type transport system substrate-binding protein